MHSSICSHPYYPFALCALFVSHMSKLGYERRPKGGALGGLVVESLRMRNNQRSKTDHLVLVYSFFNPSSFRGTPACAILTIFPRVFLGSLLRLSFHISRSPLLALVQKLHLIPEGLHSFIGFVPVPSLSIEH